MLGLRTKLKYFELAHFVSQRLSRPGDIAVDFGSYFLGGERGVAGEVVEGALARPALGMQARIDDQTTSAPHFVAEPAKMVIRRLVEIHFDPELFRIESPTFAEGMRIEVEA